MEENILLSRFFFKIEATQNHEFRILIQSEKTKEIGYIGYTPLTKSLVFLENNPFSNYLKTQEHQLRKMLHNKRLDTFFIGFEMQFILWENKDMKQFSNRSKIIVLDRRSEPRKIFVSEKSNQAITNVYTDGSFLEKKERVVMLF